MNRDSLKPNPARVGQAVYDILAKGKQETQEVGETVEAATGRYYQELFDTIKSARQSLNYDNPFYVVVLRKKEFWAVNVLRQWYVARQTRPHANYLRSQYPNHDHDVWLVDGDDIRLQWTLPTKQDSATIMRNKEMYDESLVRWIMDYDTGRLE